jgi:hypothetical protein
MLHCGLCPDRDTPLFFSDPANGFAGYTCASLVYQNQMGQWKDSNCALFVNDQVANPTIKEQCCNLPTKSPTKSPTAKPVTMSPRPPTKSPTAKPVTMSPTKKPTAKPVIMSPTKSPTAKPVPISPVTSPAAAGSGKMMMMGKRIGTLLAQTHNGIYSRSFCLEYSLVRF